MQRGLAHGRIPENRRAGDCTHIGDVYIISTGQLGQRYVQSGEHGRRTVLFGGGPGRPIDAQLSAIGTFGALTRMESTYQLKPVILSTAPPARAARRGGHTANDACQRTFRSIREQINSTGRPQRPQDTDIQGICDLGLA